MKRGASAALTIAEIVLIAASLRAAITAVGPLIGEIRVDLELSAASAGLLTTLPLIAFAAFSPAAGSLAVRLGAERLVAAAMALIAAGVLVRSGGNAAVAFAGTALLGAGIATGNVLLPGLVRRAFPRRGGSLTALYVTVMAATAGVGAAISVPLAEGAGLGWRGALAVWALVPALALVAWVIRARRVREATREVKRRSVALPWRSGLAWQVTIFMGAQSFVFYGLVAWLPAVLRADGVSPTVAGLMLGLTQLASLAATMTVPVIAGRTRTQTSLVATSSALCLAGFAGLLLSSGEQPALWAILLGLGSGAWFSLALMLLILRSPDAEHTAALSGMAQSVGYGIAAAAPIALGAIHDVTGSWTLPLVVFLAVTGVVWLSGIPAGRDRVYALSRASASGGGHEGNW